MIRVNLGLLGRSNGQGVLILLTATTSDREIAMGSLQKWFEKATPQRMMKPFPLPSPTEGGPQKVAAILDTVTDPEFINSLQTSCRVEIQGTLFEISFEFSPERTLIIAPDRLSEDHFRGFMGTILAAGFTGAETGLILTNQMRASLNNKDLNPQAAQPSRDLFLQHAGSLQLAFFLGTSPRKEDSVLHGVFNIEAREQRRTISSLAQGSETNREQWRGDILKAVELLKSVTPSMQSRDAALDPQERLDANERLRAKSEMVIRTVSNLQHKALAELVGQKQRAMDPIIQLTPLSELTEANDEYDRVLPSSWPQTIIDEIERGQETPPVQIWISGPAYLPVEESVKKGSATKTPAGQRDRLAVIRTMLFPHAPLYISFVIERTLKMVVIDMAPAEVENLKKASTMQAARSEQGVVTGTFTAQGTWGNCKLRWHTKGAAEDRAHQPPPELWAPLLQEELERGQLVFVPRRSHQDNGVVMDGEGGEDVSLVADLVASPDTSTWTWLEREGTDETVREGLPEALRSSLSLSEDQRTAFDVVMVPPGTFVRIGNEFYGPAAPEPAKIPWYISAVPTTLGFPTVSSSSVLGMLGKWRVGGTVMTVVISQDLIAYVASGIVKALGADLTATIALSIRPGMAAADVIHDGLQTSLGELLSEKASKCGFFLKGWRFNPPPALRRIWTVGSSPGGATSTHRKGISAARGAYITGSSRTHQGLPQRWGLHAHSFGLSAYTVGGGDSGAGGGKGNRDGDDILFYFPTGRDGY
jgi:hypothetical protein